MKNIEIERMKKGIEIELEWEATDEQILRRFELGGDVTSISWAVAKWEPYPRVGDRKEVRRRQRRNAGRSVFEWSERVEKSRLRVERVLRKALLKRAKSLKTKGLKSI